MLKSKSPLFILYGSATGNGEHIAKDLASKYELLLSAGNADAFFPSVVCCELDKFKKHCQSLWEEEHETKHGVLVITSTTGNGDPPENAGRFVRYIKRKNTLPTQPFRNCNYAVLGLGDTNYDIFCACAKEVDKKMAELGGNRIKTLACADEGTGTMEETVEPWVEGIFAEITNACRGENVANDQTTEASAAADENPAKTVTQAEKSEPSMGVSCDSPGWKILCSLLKHDPIKSIGIKIPAKLPSSNLNTCKFVASASGETTISEDNSLDGESVYTQKNPYISVVKSARYLTNTPLDAASKIHHAFPGGIQSVSDAAKASAIINSQFPLKDNPLALKNGKRVIEITCKLPDDASYQYQPGDALGLLVPNPPQAVDFVLEMMHRQHQVDRRQLVSINGKSGITVEKAISECIDLGSVVKGKWLLSELSAYAENPAEKEALLFLAGKSPESCAAFQEFVETQRRTIVDLLRDFPSCQGIPLEALFGMLPSIPVRYYSVCSSPLKNNGGELSIALSIVDYLTPSLLVDGKECGQRRIAGVATSFLERSVCGYLTGSSEASTELAIFPKPNESFRLPTTLDTPIILLGPGTGVAPFIGFLQHRQAQKATGSADLFFGCRHKDHDWLYQDQTKALDLDGTLSHNYVAFSRDETEPRQYIQDIIKTSGKYSVVDAIANRGAVTYLCGDGNKMAKDVQIALVDILAEHLGGDAEKAQLYFDALKSEGRFLLDVWS